MTNKQNSDEKTLEMETEPKNSESETSQNSTKDKNPEIFSRVFYSLLFALIGWMALWVFVFVVLIQFGFLLITGQVNHNLKAFNREIGLYLFDMIKYLSFHSNVKPFPFRDWPYDKENNNNSELSDNTAVKTAK